LEVFEAVKAIAPAAIYHPLSRMVVVGEAPLVAPDAPCVLVVTAGTSDLPVAEEAGVPLIDVIAEAKRVSHC
jgi:NCAIR mutase (PurE)-related protein